MVFVLIFAALIYFRLLRTSRSLWIHLNVKYDNRLNKKTSASFSKQSETIE